MDKYKFDSKLKKEGWAGMKKILDSEMPVKRKRYIYIWFVLFFLLSIPSLLFIRNKFFHLSNKSIKQNLENNNTTVIHFNKDLLDKNNKQLNKINNHNLKTQNLPINKPQKKNINKKSYKTKKNFNPNVKTKTIHLAATTNKHSIKKRELIEFLPINSATQNLSKKNTSTLFIPPFPNEIVFKKQPKIKYFNPFFEAKIHINNYNKLDPKFEFDFGNFFLLSSKVSVGFNIGIVQSDRIYQQILNRYIIASDNDLNSTGQINLFDSTYIQYPKWLMEISLMEKYQFNHNFNLGISGGMVIENLSFDVPNTSFEFTNSNISLANNKNNFISGFLETYISYIWHKNLSIKVGYKYYLINKRNTEIYTQKLTSSQYSTRFYIGLGYYF